jgi:hypothetical protein
MVANRVQHRKPVIRALNALYGETCIDPQGFLVAGFVLPAPGLYLTSPENMEYIFFAAYLIMPFIMANLAGKMGMSKIIAVGLSLIVPFISIIVYLFLWREYKKKGKAEFRVM